jgi:methanogenic corrinoid protein MtbC1
MGASEDSIGATDCGTVSADQAARYAFLEAVSHLPHLNVTQKLGRDLTGTVEAEIIPRLVLAHRNEAQRRAARPVARGSVTPSELQHFADIILLNRVDEAMALVVALSDRGVLVEAIMLDLLAPTAMKLGEMWERDDVDFFTVTLSLGRLQQVLAHLSGTRQQPSLLKSPFHKVLLAVTPGDSHIFSLLLIDQFFRRDGWDAWTMPGATRAELIDLVGRESFALVGLSISCEDCVPELRRLVPAIRGASVNKALAVMIGGPIFSERPEFALELGADATARNGRTALIEARRLLER